MIDKESLKVYIIEQRNKGLTFQNISDNLQRDFGIKRDRQAIHSMYKRAIEQENMNDEKLSVMNFAYQLRVLGYNTTKITAFINERGYKISYNKVREILSSNPVGGKEFRKVCMANIINMVGEGCTRNDLLKVLSINGIQPTDKALNEFVYEALGVIIANKMKNRLVYSCRLLGGKIDIQSLFKYVESNLRNSEIEALSRLDEK